MDDTAKVPHKPDSRPAHRRPLIDDELADQLLGNAQEQSTELLGPDGLLSQVTKAVLERALTEVMTFDLGYEKHDPAGRGSGNSRNGTTSKTVLTDVGRSIWPCRGTAMGASGHGSYARARPGWRASMTASSRCMRAG
jgi:hypothetical protein